MPGALSSVIRPAIPDDLATLAAIDATCFPPGIAYPTEEIAALLRARNSLTVVAEKSSTVVGFAALRIFRPRLFTARSSRAELITIDVLPQFRREHIGIQLYSALETWLVTQQGSSIELHVAVDNTAAINFYQPLGFRMMSRVPRYYMGEIDAWKMEKILADISDT